MKFSACLFVILFPLLTKATNYYIDPSATGKKASGTLNDPWKSFESLYNIMSSIKPGDSILLKRGEIFFEYLNLKCSGTENEPIVVTGYGPHKNNPVFIYKIPEGEDKNAQQFAIRANKSNYLKFEAIDVTDDHIDPDNHSIPANIKIAFSIDTSNFITIQNCKISLVGIGINLIGSNNFIDHCNIQNLRMVYNTKDTENDDYGANGIVLAGADNVISNCIFLGCWANSYDFEFDGGAIEMTDSACDRNRIIHNTAVNCNGFMEFGSTNGGVIENNFVENNLVLNCSDLLYINNDGPYKVKVESLELVNNIFIQTFPQLTRPESMISMRKKPEEKQVIILRGNIFWLSTEINVARPFQFEGEALIHTNNIYYLHGGKLNYPLDKSEKTLNPSSEELQHLVKEKSFQNIDFYPFFLLLKFWYLMI